MSVYSFSQIQTYLQCPLQYKFRYIDKIIPESEENLHLILGTEVHSALEWLYQKINSFVIPSWEELEKRFLENFNNKAKNLEEDSQTIEEFRLRGKYYLKNFYNKNYPFENIRVIGTEVHLYINLDDNIKFQGYIDRLDKVGKDFVITDYKTNKSLPPEDKTYYKEQLTLYALGVKQKYGKYFDKIYGNLEYLHFDLKDFWEISDEEIQIVKEKYLSLVKEIEAKKVEFNLGGSEVFLPNESPNCKFCDYKSICPLFAQVYGEVDYKDLGEEALKSLIDEYVKLSKQKSEIEKNLKENKKIIEKFANDNNLSIVYGNESKIKISSLVSYKILDKQKLLEILKDKNLLDEVLDIDRFKLNKLLKEKKLDIDLKVLQPIKSLVFRGSKK